MKYVIHWFRRDLRLDDNQSLHRALQSGLPVKCIFIFDENILKQLPKKDKRVKFIFNQLEEIKLKLRKLGSDLWIFYGTPNEVFQELSRDKNLHAVFANRDYESYAIERDKAIYKFLKEKTIKFKGFKDQVIFEKTEITTQHQTPYTVYTPYMRSWKEKLFTNQNEYLKEYDIQLNKNNLFQGKQAKTINLVLIGFETVEVPQLPLNLSEIDIKMYDKTRNLPAANTTSLLGTALRFGTLSIRSAMKFAMEHNEVFWNELIWREFFMQILYNFPKVENGAF